VEVFFQRYIALSSLVIAVMETVELKFRIYDGTDLGHSTYASSMTVATLKQKLVAEWPQGLSSFVV
jgi:hypothetical protein